MEIYRRTFLLFAMVACVCPAILAQRTYHIVWIDEFRERLGNNDRFSEVGLPELSNSLKQLCTELCGKKHVTLDERTASVSRVSMGEAMAGAFNKRDLRFKRRNPKDTIDFGILTLFLDVKEENEYSVSSEVCVPVTIDKDDEMSWGQSLATFTCRVPYEVAKGCGVRSRAVDSVSRIISSLTLPPSASYSSHRTNVLYGR